MDRNEFAAGLGARMMDKEAIIGKLVAGPVAKAMRRSFGMSPSKAVGVGRFAATAAPMIAGGFLSRSENPLVSGIGTAMSFAPMFGGMAGPKVVGGKRPKRESFFARNKIAPTHNPNPKPGWVPPRDRIMPATIPNPRPSQAKPWPGSFD